MSFDGSHAIPVASDSLLNKQRCVIFAAVSDIPRNLLSVPVSRILEMEQVGNIIV